MILSVLSFVIGFIFGYYLFKFIYKFFNFNIKEHGPDSNKIKKEIFKLENNFYSFKPIPVICPSYYNQESKNKIFLHYYEIFKILFQNLKKLFRK